MKTPHLARAASTTFPLGKIRGIRVSAHWSAALLFGALMWFLLDGGLAGLAPGYAAAAYVITALLTTAAMAVSLLAHQISHAFAAQHRDVPVKGITFSAAGCACDMGETGPRAAGLVARTGPLASFATALTAVAASAAVQAAGGPVLANAALIVITILNMAIGVFSLIPAGSLDGGRILLAILVAQGMATEKATAWVMWAGRAIAIAIAIAGVTLLLSQSAGLIFFDAVAGLFILAASHPSPSTVLRPTPAESAATAP